MESSEKFLEDYIKQSLLPLVLPLNQDTLKSLKDDKRKIVLTILEDEEDEKSKELIKMLKAAASANRDLIFGYVGVKQWEDFVESFEIYKKTQFPKMVVWDGNEDYYLHGKQSRKFCFFRYRGGNVIRKQISGPSFKGFFKSQLGVTFVLILICLVLVIVVILSMAKEEPLTFGTRDQVNDARSAALQPESRELRRPTYKED